MTNLPAHGARIVFETVPAGSYASVGTTYRVEVYGSKRRTVRLINEATGAGTFDEAAMYRRAEWSAAS